MFSPLFPYLGANRQGQDPREILPAAHHHRRMRIVELLLWLLVHYRYLMLAIWIGTMIFWLVSEVWLAEPEILEPDSKDLR